MVIGTQRGDQLLRRLGRHGVGWSWLACCCTVVGRPEGGIDFASRHWAPVMLVYFHRVIRVASVGDDVGRAVAVPPTAFLAFS